MMKKSSKTLSILSATALAPLAIVLSQAPVSALTLILNNFTFPGGSTAIGSFNYDIASKTISNWNITTSASQGFSEFTYTPATSRADAPSFTGSLNDRAFFFTKNSSPSAFSQRIFGIFLTSPVDNTIPATYSNQLAAEVNTNFTQFSTSFNPGTEVGFSAGFRVTTTGEINAVPEPEQILGIGVALGFICLFGKTYYKKSKLKPISQVEVTDSRTVV